MHHRQLPLGFKFSGHVHAKCILSKDLFDTSHDERDEFDVRSATLSNYYIRTRCNSPYAIQRLMMFNLVLKPRSALLCMQRIMSACSNGKLPSTCRESSPHTEKQLCMLKVARPWQIMLKFLPTFLFLYSPTFHLLCFSFYQYFPFQSTHFSLTL